MMPVLRHGADGSLAAPLSESPPRTWLTGLVGMGIAGSRSPEMHEREAACRGIPLVYRLLDFAALGLTVEALPTVIDWAERLGFDGLNVTHPFKNAVISSLTSLSPDAQALQAVNTIVFRDGGRRGHNTDVYGFTESLRTGLPGIAFERVVQVGAGGAAAATGHALLGMGVRDLAIYDPVHDRAERLANRLGELFPQTRVRGIRSLEGAFAEAQGVVQTSPVGMSSHPGMPFDPALLRPEQWIADIIYFPEETALLKAARARGCATLGGLGMAAYQAAAAFALFTDLPADGARMYRALQAGSVDRS